MSSYKNSLAEAVKLLESKDDLHLSTEDFAAKLTEHVSKLDGFKIGETDFLIVIVGTSVDPLLLSVAIHCPKLLALVYTDESAKYAEQVRKFAADKISSKTAIHFGPDWDIAWSSNQISDPAQMYNSLKNKWEQLWQEECNRNECEQIGLDVAGGKKTMTAAALQFAAVVKPRNSINTFPTYYVDFDQYVEPGKRKPNPNTNHIRKITNPAEIYLFDQLDELKSLFASRYYKAAVLLVERIKGNVSREELNVYYSSQSKDNWEKLLKYITGLDLWYTDAKYKDAYDELQKSTINSVPYAIRQLGKQAVNLDHLPSDSPSNNEGSAWNCYLIHLIDEFHRAVFLALYEEEYTRAFLEAARILELSAKFFLKYQDRNFRVVDYDPNWIAVENWVQNRASLYKGRNPNINRSSPYTTTLSKPFDSSHCEEVFTIREMRNDFVHRTVRADWEDNPNRSKSVWNQITRRNELLFYKGTRTALRLAHQRLRCICESLNFPYLNHFQINGQVPDQPDNYLKSVIGKDKFARLLDAMHPNTRAYYPPLGLPIKDLL